MPYHRHEGTFHISSACSMVETAFLFQSNGCKLKSTAVTQGTATSMMRLFSVLSDRGLRIYGGPGVILFSSYYLIFHPNFSK
jgi:hypothetical protein